MKHMALAFLLLLIHQPATSACGAEDPQWTIETRTIDLTRTPSKDALYLRAGHYALLVDRGQLMTQVSGALKKAGRPSDKELLAAVRQLTPAARPSDLFAIALENPFLLQPIELHVANLLEAGSAMVVDVFELKTDTRHHLDNISIRRKVHGSFRSRSFCSPSGDLLLEVVDAAS